MEPSSQTDARSQLFRWLCGSTEKPAETLSQGEWDWIAEVARGYRLRPLLHLRASAGSGPPFPPDFAEECAQAFTKQQIRWLAIQVGILRTSRALSEAGVPHVFLKGAAIALGFATEPAARPMRDLDILVPPEHARTARDVLLAMGFESLPGDLEAALDRGYQQPALVHAGNRLVVELHHDLAALPSQDTAPLAAFVLDSAQQVPLAGHSVPISAPCATFLHLLLHAGPKSLFDCGPLLLADIACLIETQADRLGDLTDRVAQFELLPTLALVLRLLDRYGADTGGLRIDRTRLPQVSDALVDHAEGLLVQSVEAVHQRKMVRDARGAERRSDALKKVVSRALLPSRTGIVEVSGGRIDDRFLWLRYPHWLVRRAWQLLSGLRDRSLKEEVAKDRGLSAFLFGEVSPADARIEASAGSSRRN